MQITTKLDAAKQKMNVTLEDNIPLVACELSASDQYALAELALKRAGFKRNSDTVYNLPTIKATISLFGIKFSRSILGADADFDTSIAAEQVKKHVDKVRHEYTSAVAIYPVVVGMIDRRIAGLIDEINAIKEAHNELNDAVIDSRIDTQRTIENLSHITRQHSVTLSLQNTAMSFINRRLNKPRWWQFGRKAAQRVQDRAQTFEVSVDAVKTEVAA